MIATCFCCFFCCFFFGVGVGIVMGSPMGSDHHRQQQLGEVVGSPPGSDHHNRRGIPQRGVGRFFFLVFNVLIVANFCCVVLCWLLVNKKNISHVLVEGRCSCMMHGRSRTGSMVGPASHCTNKLVRSGQNPHFHVMDRFRHFLCFVPCEGTWRIQQHWNSFLDI